MMAKFLTQNELKDMKKHSVHLVPLDISPTQHLLIADSLVITYQIGIVGMLDCLDNKLLSIAPMYVFLRCQTLRRIQNDTIRLVGSSVKLEDGPS
jgi:hypothetical protein